jgi:hypothetical protein
MATMQLHEENLAKVTAHIDAECSGDVDQIVGTVAPDPRFFVVTKEEGKLELEVAESPAAVREHYVNLHSSLDVLRSRQIRRIIGDWFVFQQSVATMRPHADTQSENGNDFAVDTAIVFPIAEGGILGEIPWNRLSFADAMASKTAHHEPPPAELMEAVDLHEGLLTAWTSAEESKVVDFLEDDCALGIRNCTDADGALCIGHGKEATRAALAEQFRTWKPDTFTILDLVVTDWYVFSSVRWIGSARSKMGNWSPHEMSTATITPISESNRFRAIIGYGTALMPL